MPQLPVPQAARLKRPSWRDTRLVVGVLLIAIGMLVGVRVVSAAEERVGVYAAKDPIVPGQKITPDNLRLVQVRFDESQHYLTESDALGEDSVAVRPVGAGELMPRGGLGKPADVAARAVAVPAAESQRAWLHRGDTVDLWVTPKEGTPRTPRKLLSNTVVADVPSTDAGGFGARSQNGSVQILVPPTSVADVVGAVDREDSITIVPVKQNG